MVPALRRALSSYGPRRAGCKPGVLPALLLVVAVLFCGVARAADTGPLRILAIGDSLMQGYGLTQGDGLVPQLRRWLADHGRKNVDLVNMGVSGDTTAGGLARLDWALGEGADAVILELGANDMLRGIAPATVRKNLDAMLAKLKAQDVPVLLVGMESSGNYGPAYKKSFDAIYPDLAQKYGVLLEPFYFKGMIGHQNLFQADQIHPNKQGVAVAVGNLGPYVLKLIGEAEARRSQETAQKGSK